MRPLLPDEEASAEEKVISFPSTVEAMGRGLDLLQNGILAAISSDTHDHLFFIYLCGPLCVCFYYLQIEASAMNQLHMSECQIIMIYPIHNKF